MGFTYSGTFYGLAIPIWLNSIDSVQVPKQLDPQLVEKCV